MTLYFISWDLGGTKSLYKVGEEIRAAIHNLDKNSKELDME